MGTFVKGVKRIFSQQSSSSGGGGSSSKRKESFTYSGSPFTLTNTPTFVYSVVFGGMVIHETTDYTLVGTTLTITNTDITNGDKIYITYEY